MAALNFNLDPLIARLIAVVDKSTAPKSLGLCQHETEGIPCYQPAVVHSLDAEQNLCMRHFLQAELRRELKAL